MAEARAPGAGNQIAIAPIIASRTRRNSIYQRRTNPTAHGEVAGCTICSLAARWLSSAASPTIAPCIYPDDLRPVGDVAAERHGCGILRAICIAPWRFGRESPGSPEPGARVTSP